MNAQTTPDHTVSLTGINGSNPLAFLAALGTLRTLSLAIPNASVSMAWRCRQHWHPVLRFASPVTIEDILDVLTNRLGSVQTRPEFHALGDDLSVGPELFRRFAVEAARSATRTDRRTADFAAAFGCEATIKNEKTKRTIQDTSLRTMAGAGHQHFLGSMRKLIQATQREHLRKSLFEPWRYDDPVKNLTMRWDPIDDVRYALRWRNPSGDPLRNDSGSVLGANRLAIEGLPCLPTAPRANVLFTTGFRGQKSSNTFWTWPIWENVLSLDVIRTVLQLVELQQQTPNRASLLARGIVEVFRAQRLTIGKVRSFSPGQSI